MGRVEGEREKLGRGEGEEEKIGKERGERIEDLEGEKGENTRLERR